MNFTKFMKNKVLIDYQLKLNADANNNFFFLGGFSNL